MVWRIDDISPRDRKVLLLALSGEIERTNQVLEQLDRAGEQSANNPSVSERTGRYGLPARREHRE